LEAVLKYVGRARQKLNVDGKLYNVAMNNQRMKLIGRTQDCACCGAMGRFFWLEQSGTHPPHFNLYAEDHTGRDILLTMDLIRPASEGGKAEPGNLQLLCVSCQRKKGNRNISNGDLLAERCAEEESLKRFFEQRRAHEESP
jgi:5-methylcytosine-specific restriction endonuclease McrA